MSYKGRYPPIAVYIVGQSLHQRFFRDYSLNKRSFTKESLKIQMHYGRSDLEKKKKELKKLGMLSTQIACVCVKNSNT